MIAATHNKTNSEDGMAGISQSPEIDSRTGEGSGLRDFMGLGICRVAVECFKTFRAEMDFFRGHLYVGLSLAC